MSAKAVPQRRRTDTTLSPVGPGTLQRKCACGGRTLDSRSFTESKKKRTELQRRAIDGSEVSEVPPIVHGVLRSPGRPLDDDTRQFMESRFGHDFSRVRVHIDNKAAESARAVNASAYTVGSHIAFGGGAYTPQTTDGRRLLAHELTHVLQQGQSLDAPRRGLAIAPDTETPEREARAVAARTTDPTSHTSLMDARNARVQGAAPPGNWLLRQTAGPNRLGRTQPRARCDPPVCLADPSELFGFQFDSDELRAGEEERLRTFGDGLAPDDALTILGYASVEGPEDYNTTLACHRAIRVKQILEVGTLGTISTIHAVGETEGFGPELAQNRVAQVFIHRQLPAPVPPTPTPEPTPESTQPPNCGCHGSWEVSRTFQVNVGCRCTWVCAPPPGIYSAQPRPTFGCSGGPVVPRGPQPRRTWGVMVHTGEGGLESGDTCRCIADDCMTTVGLRSRKPGK